MKVEKLAEASIYQAELFNFLFLLRKWSFNFAYRLLDVLEFKSLKKELTEGAYNFVILM